MTTLSQLLTVPELGLRLVQAGAEDPELGWVSVTELLDLSPYLEGGEVILTTGLALSTEDPRWWDFVADLSRAQVAAIGFGVGVNHERIPGLLVQAASAYRVALFEIPLPTPFIAVAKAAAELLRTDELRAARVALSAGRRLLDAARGEQSPAEVLATIAQATGQQLALIGTDGAVLASTAGYARVSGPSTEHVDLDPEGSLQLAVAGDATLSTEGRSVIAAGAMVLSLTLRGDRADANRERERWERLTDGLLHGTQDPRSSKILVPVLELPERVRVLALQGAAEDVSDWRRRRRTGLDRLVAPAPLPDAPGLARAWQICAASESVVERALVAAAQYGLDAIVGRPADLVDAPVSRRSAEALLRSLSKVAPLYSTPRVPEQMWAERATPALEVLLEQNGSSISRSVLGPLSLTVEAAGGLTEEDRRTLRDTLRAVFETDGQRGPAAAALGIHRNTLRDRIARAERLTGRSLANVDDRAELWFALRLEELSR
ncbi:MAG: PucR family transcriptional regulator [Leucobacter sp.]